MPLDINAIYQGQPPMSLPQVYAAAAEIQDFKQKQAQTNALKALFANPANVDPATGMPTKNALAQLMQVSPQAGLGLMGQEAKISAEQSETAKRQEDSALERAKFWTDNVLKPATDAYDKAIGEGKTPEQAKEIGQRIYSDGYKGAQGSGMYSPDQVATQDTAFDPDRAHWQIRAVNAKTKGFVPVEMTDASGNTFQYDPNSRSATFISGPAGLKMGEPFEPSGAVQKIGGGGMARSAAAMATARYLQEHPGATSQDVADFAATFKRTEVAGAGAAEADKAELTNLRKMQGNVHTFIGEPAKDGKPSTGAFGEADLVRSLMDKGLAKIPGGLNGPVFNTFWNQARAGLGDPDVIALRNALLSLQQENAKIMQGSTGSVAAVSDQMSREIQSQLNGNFNAAQLNAAIHTMQAGWSNRKTGIDDQVAAVEARLEGRRPGGSKTEASARSRSDAYLKAHDTPQNRKFYDQRYGEGAAERVLGGG